MLGAVRCDFRRIPETMVVISGDFQKTAANCDWTLVIAPEFDDHLRGLSQTVLDVGGRLLGSQPAAIALTGDKLATANFWQNRGVRHPRTEALDPERFASFQPPWVMKPRCGAGSQATFFIRNQDDALRVWSPAYHECDDEEFIVQEFVRGRTGERRAIDRSTANHSAHAGPATSLARWPISLSGWFPAIASRFGLPRDGDRAGGGGGDRRPARVCRRRSRARCGRQRLRHRDQSALDHVIHRTAATVSRQFGGVDAALCAGRGDGAAAMEGWRGKIRPSPRISERSWGCWGGHCVDRLSTPANAALIAGRGAHRRAWGRRCNG